jgi:hypothetical protein
LEVSLGMKHRSQPSKLSQRRTEVDRSRDQQQPRGAVEGPSRLPIWQRVGPW